MAESKRILSSPLATVEFSTTQLRLIGAFNAAGFAAAGSAFQSATLSAMQPSLKVMMTTFIMGIIAFVASSILMVFATFAADGMEGVMEEASVPEDRRVYRRTGKSYTIEYYCWLIPACICGGLSLLFLMIGLGHAFVLVAN
jgi:hypothetical protein